jgi:hypothetical protein
MEAPGCSETFVPLYQTTWSHNPEDSNIYKACLPSAFISSPADVLISLLSLYD